jgi:membrane fusion protein, copper/silver efflux system
MRRLWGIAMNRIKLGGLIFSVAILGVIVGSHFSGFSVSHVQAAGKPRVLYYRDPMHPAYTSNKPGFAPDCGMKLEPVYEKERAEPAEPQSAGGVIISAEKQQLIGIRLARVENTPAKTGLHFIGKVKPDETRMYRITAAADGWMQDAKPISTGSLVSKGERLAEFYSPEFLGAEQAYLFALRSLDRFQESGKEPADQIALTKTNVQQYADTLRNMGMTEAQIEDLKRTRQITQRIWISAPAAGMVLTRNIWPGQRFERGTEFFRIADLSHIWVVADVYDTDWNFVRPGTHVTITQRSESKTFAAKISNVLPQFDPDSRTLKLRLETANPDYQLRPDMFVDVDIAVAKASVLSVPADAVLETGSHDIVWVCRGDGIFEPRRVHIGTRFNDRVEIIAGLSAGEEVVVSGNFLLDSDSRMRTQAERPFSDQDESNHRDQEARDQAAIRTLR